jgi:hypothetical protein
LFTSGAILISNIYFKSHFLYYINKGCGVMKKTLRYSFFSFILSFICLIFGSKVCASTGFWEEIGSSTSNNGGYDLIQTSRENSEKFKFSDEDKAVSNYNYDFEYDYKITTTNYITDGNGKIYTFYGITGETSVSYENLVGSMFQGIDDKFTIYKYNFTGKEFDTDNIVCNPKKNTSGTCTIDTIGLYKLETSGIDGYSRNAYVLYEDSAARVDFDSIEYEASGKVLKLQLTVFDPRSLNSNNCAISNLKINDTSDSSIATKSCEFSWKSNSSYNAMINLDVSKTSSSITNGKISFSILGNDVSKDGVVNFDVKAPKIKENIKYYNRNYLKEELKIEYTNSNITITNNSVSRITASHENEITLRVNGYNICTVESSSNNEVNYLCDISQLLPNEGETTLTYTIQDSFGNVTEVQNTLVIDAELLPSSDEILNYLTIDSNGKVIVTNNNEENKYFSKACLFYGTSLVNQKQCVEDTTSDAIEITPAYAYKGHVIVLVSDNALNIAKAEYDVDFKNGYDENDFKLNEEVALENKDDEFDFSENHSKLVGFANVDEIKTFVKYGDLLEEITDDNYKLPSYLVMLNEKFRDSTCASKSCDKSVEIYISYNVGGSEQTLSMFYNFTDKLPYIKDELSIEDVTLEYGNVDIESNTVKNKLYGDGLSVTLTDGTNNYSGKIVASFVQYTDRSGNATLIDNQPYTYIANSDNNVGYYLLECKVQLEIDDNTSYLKSFFIKVNLKDSKLPTLSLDGDEKVDIQQYDVYKDAGYKCSDASGCTVTINYYLNDESNKVDEINTKVAGKYIIVFEAVDGDGNKVVAKRIVNVNPVNSLDTTSIIVIASVVVLFVLFITLGIIHEVRKSKKYKEKFEE